MTKTEIEVAFDLGFWGLPVCMRWSFGDVKRHDYLAIHFLCFEVIINWYTYK